MDCSPADGEQIRPGIEIEIDQSYSAPDRFQDRELPGLRPVSD